MFPVLIWTLSTLAATLAQNPFFPHVSTLTKSPIIDQEINSQLRDFYPKGIVLDSSGNLIFSDIYTNCIIKSFGKSELMCIVGNPSGSTTDLKDGYGEEANLLGTSFMAIDSDDTVYFADFTGDCVRKVTKHGQVITIAGNPKTYTFKDGPALTATFYHPTDVMLDNSGNIYVTDTYNHLIRKINATGWVSTFAGQQGIQGLVNSYRTSSRFRYPRCIVADKSYDNFYICDSSNNVVRKINSTGFVSTHIGNGTVGFLDGPALECMLNYPSDLEFAKNGDLMVVERLNHVIRKLDSLTGIVTTVVGAGKPGSYDGKGTDAELDTPQSIAYDRENDEFYITESVGQKIRKLSPNGFLTTVVKCTDSGFEDGPGYKARFSTSIASISLKGNHTLYIADKGNTAIRKLDLLTNTVSTIIYSRIPSSVDGQFSQASIGSPTAVFYDPTNDRLLFGERTRVREIDFTTKSVTTIAGSDLETSINGNLSEARFKGVESISRHDGLNPYLLVATFQEIRKIQGNTVSSVAGNPDSSSSTCKGGKVGVSNFNGPLDLFQIGNNHWIFGVSSCESMASLSGNDTDIMTIEMALGSAELSGLAYDGKGNILMLDSFSQCLNNVSIASKTSHQLIKGIPNYHYTRDGFLSDAALYSPNKVVIEKESGTVYFSERFSIRRIIGKRVETIAGYGAVRYDFTNSPVPAFLDRPFDLAIDSKQGDIYITDVGNNCIVRYIKETGKAIVFAGNGGQGLFNSAKNLLDSQFYQPKGIAFGPDGNLYIADSSNHAIRRIRMVDGLVETYFGVGIPGYQNGNQSETRFNDPTGITFDETTGDMFVTDSGNHVIRRISGGRSSLYAGSPSIIGKSDGHKSNAKFYNPTFIVWVKVRNVLYVSDTKNHMIRMIDLKSGMVSTIAGSRLVGRQDGLGPNQTTMHFPKGLAVTSAGDILFFADTMNNAIRAIDLTLKQVYTISGGNGSGLRDGDIALYKVPVGLAYDNDGKYLLVADSRNAAVRRVDLWKTFSATSTYNNLDPGMAARVPVLITLTLITLILLTSSLYFAYRYRIHKMSISKKLSTFATKEKTTFLEATKTASVSQSVAIAAPGYLQIDLKKCVKFDGFGETGSSGATAQIMKGQLIDPTLIKMNMISDVAVKYFKDFYDSKDAETESEYRSRFLYEVTLMANLPNSPHLTKLIGYSEQPKCIIMKYYKLSMMDLLHDRKFQENPGNIKKATIDIAKGMEALHNRNIIHFDLKPGNILVDLNPDLTFNFVICDFGFSNFVADSRRYVVSGMRKPTVAGITPRYAAPELFGKAMTLGRLEAEIDKKVDVFAYSMILYWLVTGIKAWDGKTNEEIESKVIDGERPSIPETHHTSFYYQLIIKCWHQNASDRPTFTEILGQLNKN